MFIQILFGYKQKKIFTIDCLTATLVDCIWSNCTKEIQKILIQKEDLVNKELASHQKKQAILDKKIETLEKQIKDEEEKKIAEEEAQKKKDLKVDPKNTKDLKKETKPAVKAPPVQNSKNKNNVPSNPLEKDKMDTQAELDKLKDVISKYQQKLVKQKEYKDKLQNQNSQPIIIEFLEKTGERKFVKTKLDQVANTFLTDKQSYVLSLVKPPLENSEEDEIDIIQIEGFCMRTVEEDEKAIDELFTLNTGKPTKDNKKALKKGK